MSILKEIAIELQETNKKLNAKVLDELIEDWNGDKLSSHQQFQITKIVKVIKQLQRMNTIASMNDIKFIVKDTPRMIRKYIQLSRIYAHIFYEKDEFLIAYNSGYAFTKDKQEIKDFFHKTQVRYSNTTLQLLNMLKIIE